MNKLTDLVLHGYHNFITLYGRTELRDSVFLRDMFLMAFMLLNNTLKRGEILRKSEIFMIIIAEVGTEYIGHIQDLNLENIYNSNKCYNKFITFFGET